MVKEDDRNREYPPEVEASGEDIDELNLEVAEVNEARAGEADFAGLDRIDLGPLEDDDETILELPSSEATQDINVEEGRAGLKDMVNDVESRVRKRREEN